MLWRMASKDEREWSEQLQAMSADDLRQRWAREFKVLSGDVHRIHWNREVFEALDEEIVRTSRDGSGFFLERFLRPMYVENQTLLLRRLGDVDRRSSSFRVMLEEMILRPEVLTREWYVARWADFYEGDPDYVRVGDDEFSSNFGERARRVPVRVLRRYRDELVVDLEHVKKFVDKFVAHRDRLTAEPITWAELNAAIERLEHHLNAVGVIVSGASTRAKATVIDDWRNVFREGLFQQSRSRRR
jgi:hypothetical protein